MIRNIIMAACLAAVSFSCGRVQDSMEAVDPGLVAQKFFKAWQNRDWHALYELSHPAFMQKVRMQKLSPELRAMSDRDLFVREFERFQASQPGMVLRTYEIKSIPSYKQGDTTLWVEATANGKKRRIPLALDGMALKVDLTRIR